MQRLTVLYDARCGLCSSARWWLEGQRQIVPLELVPADSEEARRRFPTLAASRPEELIVVSDEGDVYAGSDAWIMSLWALDEYRDWAFRMARPALRPLARGIFKWVSTRRNGLSRSLGLLSDSELAREGGDPASCEMRRP